MKNIVRILIIATLALLPTLSQAKELNIGYDEIVELSKLGLIDNTDVERYINIFESYSYIDSMLIQIILLSTVISLIIWFIIDIINDYHHIKNYDIIEQAISGKQ